MTTGGVTCSALNQPEWGQSLRLGESAPEIHSGDMGSSVSRTSIGHPKQLEIALPAQQPIQQAHESGALAPPAAVPDRAVWSSEGVLFRLDDFQNFCSINKQGGAVKACN